MWQIIRPTTALEIKKLWLYKSCIFVFLLTVSFVYVVTNNCGGPLWFFSLKFNSTFVRIGIHIQKKQKTKRIAYLDAIRGIACLMVVLLHFISFHWSETLACKLAVFIFNGNDAVSFFFVLSGFVLSYPYLQSDRKLNFGRYLKKRILRLYPAYLITVLICFFYLNRYNLSADQLYFFFIENKGPKIWNELTMVMNEHHLYYPGWTLRVEMIYSIIIIPLIIIAKKNKNLLWLVLLGSFFIGETRLRGFMIHFLLGILLSISYPRLVKMDFKSTKLYPYRWLFYVLIAVFFSFRNLKEFAPFIDSAFDFLWPYGLRWEQFSAVSAFLILALIIMNKRVQETLEGKVLLYLGKISYSIYLIHYPLVLLFMERWPQWGTYFGTGLLRFVLVLLMYLGSTVFCAHFMYKFVELPFIRLSRRASFKA